MVLFVIICIILAAIWVPSILKGTRERQALRQFEERVREEQRIARDAQRRLSEAASPMISQHIRTLARKYRQLVTEDDYGNAQFDAWYREMDYFINTNISRSVSYNDRTALFLDIIASITDYENDGAKGPRAVEDIEILTPEQFEMYCSDLLRRCNWQSRVTRRTGDQGVDIVATFGGVRAVFQCKKYSQPVGNAAVQEVTAGKAFEQADVAAVVTNSTYTPAAKQLAGMANVHLLHYTDLPRFAETLGLLEANATRPTDTDPGENP